MNCTNPKHNFLDVSQHEIVHFQNGNALVAAAAGSGKTGTTVYRIGQLIDDGSDPARIGVFTFARDASQELAKRCKDLGLPEELQISTLHSLCYEILREDGKHVGGDFNVDDGKLIWYLTKDLLSRNFRGVGLDLKIAEILFTLAKGNCLSMHPLTKGEDKEDIVRFWKPNMDKPWLVKPYLDLFQLVEDEKINRKLISFDDMLWLSWYLLVNDQQVRDKWADRFDHIIIDEAQDSSSAQNAIAKIISATKNNLMLVGDGSQSIYRWRSAKPEEFINFGKQNKILTLPVNYRCTVQICKHASILTKGKPWNLTGDTIPHVQAINDISSIVAVETHGPEDEADKICADIKDLISEGANPGSIAILYRIVSLLQPIESALLANNIPYTVWSGHTFYDRKEVKDILAYLNVAALRDPFENYVKRALNVPFRYLGKAYIEAVEDVAAANKCSFVDAVQQYKSNRESQNTSASKFVKLLYILNGLYSNGRSPSEIISTLLSETRYLQTMRMEEGEDGPDPDSGKAAHVFMLARIAEGFKTLDSFLNHVGKMEGILKETRKKHKTDAVVLSTIHRFKGIERDYVYGIGWNDGTLPHARNPDQDEEMRLAYVCMTRARKKFQCSWTRTTISPSGPKPGTPSRFIQQSQMPIRRLPVGSKQLEVMQFYEKHPEMLEKF